MALILTPARSKYMSKATSELIEVIPSEERDSEV
jgi:hypothetical protein